MFRRTRKNPITTTKDFTAGNVVPDAVDANLASRSIGFVDEGEGEGHFTVGGVPISGTLVPPAATWSGVAGRPLRSLSEFGAIADGTYNPGTGAMTGTDNTLAINAALEYGSPVIIPPGLFYYSSLLHTDVAGSGLIGNGKDASFLITDQDLDFHLGVVAGTKNTTWRDFGMIGPRTFASGTTATFPLNRAMLVGLKADLSGASSVASDCSGTFIDEVVTRGYSTGLHVSRAANVSFGTFETYETGGSGSEPGGYGVTCSGDNLSGRVLRCTNVETRGRHALYYNNVANDCFVDVVEAQGFDHGVIRNRATAGGGKRNGFGRGRFVDCNNNTGGGDGIISGLVLFVCADDIPVDGAGGAIIGDYVAINCGGYPGPELRYMPNSRCGTVRVYGHSGMFGSSHYGAHIFNSANATLPALDFVAGFDATGLNDSTLTLLRVDNSPNCRGGSVRSHSGAVFHRGALINNSVDVSGVELILDGVYADAVRLSGTSDLCDLTVTPLAAPTGSLLSDGSTGAQYNSVMRARGYDMKEVTSGATIDVTGYREVRLNYASAATITNLTGLQQGQTVKLTSMNANATLAHAAGGIGSIELSGAVNRVMGTRKTAVLGGHITGSGGSYTSRCVEVAPSSVAVAQLMGDTSTALGVGSLNIGHASDTTVARVAAGRISVEGSEVLMSRRIINAQTGTAYTLVLADAGKLVTLNNALAVTVEVPNSSTEAFALGDFIDLAQIGAGQVTVVGAAGVTVNATPGLKISARYATARLVRNGTNTWLLTGSLSA